MESKYDVLIVGAGFAGAVLAERFASQAGKRVLVLERRAQIGGNMYDHLDEAGVLVHRYGPHIFRTDDERVWRYLYQFADFNGYQHHVLAHVDGRLIPVPFNLNSIDRMFPRDEAERLTRKLVERFGADSKVPVSTLRRIDDPELADLGRRIFEKIYLNYTVKQWGDPPEALDFETITQRVPVRISRDDRYFQQRYQGLPCEGYTKLFERMLSHPKIEVRLAVDAVEHLALGGEGRISFEGRRFEGEVIYTGATDQLFGYRLGELPYRALRFVARTLDQDTFQPVGTVNYPNDWEFTRITEFKHLTKQEVPCKTSIAEEYSMEYRRALGHEPYYPIPKPASYALRDRYVEEAARYPKLHLIGRLAEYRYYDMNDIIIRALDVFDALWRG